MSQYPGNAPRRKLTPEQRQRILKMRRMRRLKKRLMVAVPVVALLVVVLAVVLTVGGGEDAAATPPLALNVEPAQSALAQGEGDPAPTQDAAQSGLSAESTEAPADGASPSAQAPAESAEASAGGATPSAQTLAQGEALPASSGSFNYDDAYIAAARGQNTGAPLTPDYSNVDPSKLDRWPKVTEGYMPLLYKANATENVICVTVDDCFQGDNLRAIVQCALDNNGKLTIFPIGDNLNKDNVASAIKWAWENGMEIENHTYNHAGMYHYDDERMTNEMWYQSVKLSQVLGVNYKQHFFRPKGGDEREDQRVHAYAKQLGMSGIAVWTQSGSRDSVQSLFNNLAPGRIYLFHTTNNDLQKLLEFIPGAVQRGYRLVTLNEMFGLPENETSDLSTIGEKPALQSFQIVPALLQKTSYVRAAAVVQKRLIELGWLEGEADGVFGDSSFMATGFFQMAAGLQPTGKANAETQKVLFSDAAPTGSKERIEELKKQLGK